MATTCADLPADPAPRRFARDESGQMLFLVMSLLLVLCALGGYVLNVADRVHERTVQQEAADAAAYTAAAETARALNFLSNANVAILEITAELAAIDAITPTVIAGFGWLIYETAQAFKLLPWAFPAFLVRIAQIVREASFLVRFFEWGQRLQRSLVPKLDAARSILERLSAVVARTTSVDLGIAALSLVPTVRGRAAARAVLPACSPYEVPPVGPPLREVGLQHYRWTGYRHLAVLVAAASAYLSQAPLSRASWMYPPIAAVCYEVRLWRDDVSVWAIEPEGEDVTQDVADAVPEGYRRIWLVTADAARPILPALFGGLPERGVRTLAAAMTFNPDDWDLITPRWEAALVPLPSPLPALTTAAIALHSGDAGETLLANTSLDH